MDVLKTPARGLVAAAVVVFIGVAAFTIVESIIRELHTPRKPLTEVYTPSYRAVPRARGVGETLHRLQDDLMSPAGDDLVQNTIPNESGVLWLALFVTLAVAFDFDRLDDPRNLDLIAMQAIGFCMFGILRFLTVLARPELVWLMRRVFDVVFALNIVLLVRALWRAAHAPGSRWRPSLPTRALAAIAVALVIGDVVVALVREPDDVGFFVNLGAQRLRERGALPYGDPLLSGSAGAAYGPLLYVAHIPFQLLVSPHALNVDSPDRPGPGAESTYYLPPQLATKLCTVAFHLLGVFALWIAGRRLAGVQVAWAVVALYAGSAYVLGIGGDRYFIGGMTYVSHIAPAAATLVAFALLPYPWASGLALAAAAGVGFYPAFMAPAWLGYYWDEARARRHFAAGFLITAAAIGLFVLGLSHADPGRGLIGTILWDTMGHHTDPHHYGFSPFSFWGQRGGPVGWMMHPLLFGSGITAPAFLLFLALSVAGFRMTRRKQAHELALVAAAVAIGASLMKIHPTGTYVAWSYPFLLIGLFADFPALATTETIEPTRVV